LAMETTSPYSFSYAPTNRAACKGKCKDKIPKDGVRFGVAVEGASNYTSVQYKCLSCMTKKIFENVTVKVGSVELVVGFDSLKPEDQDAVIAARDAAAAATAAPRPKKAKAAAEGSASGASAEPAAAPAAAPAAVPAAPAAPAAAQLTPPGTPPAPPAPTPVASSLPIAQQHAFCDLAKERNFAQVKSMLEAEPGYVNVQPAQRWSALHQFAKAGHEEAVQYLLNLHADKGATTRDGQTAVTLAHDRVRHLLGGGLTERQQHAFLDLCRDGEFVKVRQMVEAEPEYVNTQPAQRWTALHQAAGVGDKETVKLLLAKGADKAAKNRDGQTPLQVADKSVRTLLGGKRPAPDRSDDDDSEEDSFIDDDEEEDDEDEDDQEYEGDSD